MINHTVKVWKNDSYGENEYLDNMYENMNTDNSYIYD